MSAIITRRCLVERPYCLSMSAKVEMSTNPVSSGKVTGCMARLISASMAHRLAQKNVKWYFIVSWVSNVVSRIHKH